MHEPFKVNRVLPPHELNARRNRKRAVTQLPAIAQLPPHDRKEHGSPNDHLFNPAANPVTNHQ